VALGFRQFRACGLEHNNAVAFSPDGKAFVTRVPGGVGVLGCADVGDKWLLGRRTFQYGPELLA
jgi:hypothetical protein